MRCQGTGREIRAAAVAVGWVYPALADAARKLMDDAVHAQRLAEISEGAQIPSSRLSPAVTGSPNARICSRGAATCRTQNLAPCSPMSQPWAASGGSLPASVIAASN